MADLGGRILAALRSITTDPALVAKVDANIAGDEAQTVLLDQLGTTTTQLAAELSALREAVESGASGPALTARVDALQATIDSLDAAFPEPVA